MRFGPRSELAKEPLAALGDDPLGHVISRLRVPLG